MASRALSATRALAIGAGAVVVLVLVWLLVRGWPFGRAAERPSAPTLPAATSPDVVVKPQPAASAPMAESPVRYPVAAASAPSDHALDLATELTGLLGRKAVQTLLQLPDFARRFTATVDNLGRSHAPPLMWPVTPAPDRFLVRAQGDATVISADNGLRYTPYVLLLESIDLRQAVRLYFRLYPQLQRAYVELGYPRQYFNDRLVEVIDVLLATPDVEQPLRVRLPQVRGPIAPPRPWVMYEFEHPSLDELASGQKLLLRMGPVNQRRVKLKLAEIRRLVTVGPDAPR